MSLEYSTPINACALRSNLYKHSHCGKTGTAEATQVTLYKPPQACESVNAILLASFLLPSPMTTLTKDQLGMYSKRRFVDRFARLKDTLNVVCFSPTMQTVTSRVFQSQSLNLHHNHLRRLLNPQPLTGALHQPLPRLVQPAPSLVPTDRTFEVLDRPPPRPDEHPSLLTLPHVSPLTRPPRRQEVPPRLLKSPSLAGATRMRGIAPLTI